MALGLGHQYWIRIVDYFYGDLDECLKYISEHPPIDNRYWYELNPKVHIVSGQRSICSEYCCQLVTDDKY